jgi:hypothetical protein
VSCHNATCCRHGRPYAHKPCLICCSMASAQLLKAKHVRAAATSASYPGCGRLQSLPEARAAIRRFFGEGLEECGPAGLDFLTVSWLTEW